MASSNPDLTATMGWPSPKPSDPPDVPGDLKALADGVDAWAAKFKVDKYAPTWTATTVTNSYITAIVIEPLGLIVLRMLADFSQGLSAGYKFATFSGAAYQAMDGGLPFTFGCTWNSEHVNIKAEDSGTQLELSVATATTGAGSLNGTGVMIADRTYPLGKTP